VSIGDGMNDNGKLATRYDTVAIALHWSIAVLVGGMAILGLSFDQFPKATQPYWINMHAVVGLLFFALVLLRLFWRLGHRPPDLPGEFDAFSRRASHPVHLLMYAVMLAIPPLGIVAFIWHGRAFNFGLFTLDFGVKSDRAVFHPAEDYHGWLVYTLLGLIALHIAAAIWHQFIRRDHLMLRMMPGPRNPV
jgi:cytochrome b561